MQNKKESKMKKENMTNIIANIRKTGYIIFMKVNNEITKKSGYLIINF